MHNFLVSRNGWKSVSMVKTAEPPAGGIPYDRWPVWAKAISLLKTDADGGLGDTVERVIGTANSAAFKAWHLATFGKSCGCSERKTIWNTLYRYDAQSES